MFCRVNFPLRTKKRQQPLAELSPLTISVPPDPVALDQAEARQPVDIVVQSTQADYSYVRAEQVLYLSPAVTYQGQEIEDLPVLPQMGNLMVSSNQMML